MTPAKWVAVVGDNTIDRYLGHELAEYSGGNAFNVAVQLARAGTIVRYFGAVGDDSDAEIIRSGLHANGISLDDLSVLPGDTAVTDIRVRANGDRVFEREEFGVTADYYPSAAAITAIAQAAWVHIGMLPRASSLRSDLRVIKQGSVSQDCAVSSGLADLDVAFLSAGEGADARAKAAAARRAGVPTVVVTLGADGALSEDDDGVITQDALPTDVIDTTGAGDSFIAGYIAARVEGESLAAAMESGARFAAATCAHQAGWPHPARSEQELS